jgi:hypothetical protein
MSDERRRTTPGDGWLSRRMAVALTYRRLPVLAALLAITLTLPALGVGWLIDDYYHRVVLLGVPPFGDLLGPPGEMFRFFRGDPERTVRAMDLGIFPWWTDPQIKAEFLQALTVLTHRLDYRLWPDSPALMHAQSLLWYAALVAATAALYRRVMGPTVTAGVAAVLFAVDDAHGGPVGWIANRNALVAATFGVLALLAHDAWRRGGHRVGWILAPLLVAACLLAKEEGIASCAYLLAYGLVLDPAGSRRGLLALSPYAGVAVVWRGLRDASGYGVANIGLYIDPMDDPLRFAATAAGRAPFLLLGQWGLPPSDLVMALGPAAWAVLLVLALAFLAWLAATMAPILRRDRTARFWALGMLLAVVPLCAAAPMDRLLTSVGIGAFGLLAQFWAAVFKRQPFEDAPWRRRAAPLAWLLVVVHLVIAPLTLPLRAGNPLMPVRLERCLYVRTPMGSKIRGQSVVIVNAPSPGHAGYLPIVRAASGLPIPAHTRVLAPAMPAVAIRRLDERTLSIRPERGYLRWALDRVFRSERRPMSRGQRVELTGMTAEVGALTDDGRPVEVAFRFDVPLEDPSLLWLCYRGTRFEPFTPPAVGESLTIRIGGLLDLALRAGDPGDPDNAPGEDPGGLILGSAVEGRSEGPASANARRPSQLPALRERMSSSGMTAATASTLIGP